MIETASSRTPLLVIAWDSTAWSFSLTVSAVLVTVIIAIAGLVIVYKWLTGGYSLHHFEIDQAEIGVGSSKFRFKPNLTDRQVAYAVWVELSTRKIGLEIDFDHDVIAEIYDSWYGFFAVTRELIKTIPANQVKRDGTKAIIKLSIEVLNQGLRPHLTFWQARFRRWYDHELKLIDNKSDYEFIDPQQIQSRYPRYEELKADMERVNNALIRYRKKMYELVMRE